MRRKRYFIGGLVGAVLPKIIPGLIGEIIGGDKPRSGTPVTSRGQAGGGLGFLAQEAEARHQKIKDIPEENKEVLDNLNSQFVSLFSLYPQDERKDVAQKLQDLIRHG
jgi:hypothetical protein